ncbi:hypothetical protein SAMN04487771_102742 [[Clostridium] aminophilum]|uniref:Uncharacterized protein n=1 Tax=[Clostridium] aminophilum TaxID=1526 RepID=A0A1I0FRA2_9FIRM|nr:hypothetical protein SAMN04487771_102742 [[Clostridium] aminophilum]
MMRNEIAITSEIFHKSLQFYEHLFFRKRCELSSFCFLKKWCFWEKSKPPCSYKHRLTLRKNSGRIDCMFQAMLFAGCSIKESHLVIDTRFFQFPALFKYV